MKKITKKQAENWLSNLFSFDQSSYFQLEAALQRFSNTQNEFSCYNDFRKILMNNVELEAQVNQFLLQGNKFDDGKIFNNQVRNLLKNIREKQPAVYQKIVEKIHQNDKVEKILSHSIEELDLLDNQNRKDLWNEASSIKNRFQQGKMSQKDLDHLLVKEKAHQKNSFFEQINLKEDNFQKLKKMAELVEKLPQRLTNSKEREFFLIIQNSVNRKCWKKILKDLDLFTTDDISFRDAVKNMKKVLPSFVLPIIEVILKHRQSKRKFQAEVKPLDEIDFTQYPRVTPSYILTPTIYFSICSTQNDQHKSVLNKKYVSVPGKGNENFKVPQKNTYQKNLNRGEDEIYELDVVRQKLKMTEKVLTKIISNLQNNQKYDYQNDLNTIFSLNSLKIIYKPAKIQEKKKVKSYFSINPIEASNFLKTRTHEELNKINQLCQKKLNVSWEKISEKNLIPSFDQKTQTFLEMEKQKMKGKVFIEQLDKRFEELSSSENLDLKQFFSFFNSLSTLTQKEMNLQHCKHFDIGEREGANIKKYPVMIFSFKNSEGVDLAFSFIYNYLQNYKNILEQEKNNILKLLILILGKIFNEETKRFSRLSSHSIEELNKFIKKTKISQYWKLIDEKNFSSTQKEININPSLSRASQNTMTDEKWSFYPPETEKMKAFYCSQNFYVFIRCYHTVCERLAKLATFQGEKQKNYEALFYLYQQGEDENFKKGVKHILGSEGYLFIGMHKLVENLLKSLKALLPCEMTKLSLQTMGIFSEKDYFQLIFEQNPNKNIGKLRYLRFIFDEDEKVLYLNVLKLKPKFISLQAIRSRVHTFNSDEDYEPFSERKNKRSSLKNKNLSHDIETAPLSFKKKR